MKKALLLSVVASVAVMAGGDIAPVQPVVTTPAPAASGWDLSGQAVVYYQTTDAGAANDLFDQASSAADAGIQLRAVNKDVFAGVGAGFEVNGLSTLNLENGVVSNVMQGVGAAGAGDIDDLTDGGWISQAYLTYGIANTSVKLGRQELPKALSPFAFSENWNVFKNTFDAALVVNTDITDTTLVGAWVYGANHNGFGAGNNLSDFNEANGHDGIYMLTAQNKSIENLTLTGTWYYAASFADNNLGKNTGNDLNILWADAKYKLGDYLVAVQGGTYMDDDLPDDTVAFGAKVSANLGMFNASAAFSSVDENGIAGVTMRNVGGVKTPLYTQMLLNQGVISFDADYVKVAANTKLLDGTVSAAYGYAINHLDDVAGGLDNNPYEFDLTYKTKVLNGSTTLFAGYILNNKDLASGDSSNTLRVWGRYNF